MTTEETLAKVISHIEKLQKLNDLMHEALSDIAQGPGGVEGKARAHKALLDYSKIYLELSTGENKL